MLSDSFKSIFSPTSTFKPAEIVEEIDDDGEVYETVIEKKKSKKKSKYLPGEKMLKNINKTKLKKKVKYMIWIYQK